MDEAKEVGSEIEDRVARVLTGFAQRVSRRGLFARIGRLALSLLGVTTVILLPVNRVIRKVEAANCSDWDLCGIYGRPCDCCVGGTKYACPPETLEGSYWESCCYDGANGYWFRLWYIVSGKQDTSTGRGPTRDPSEGC